MNEYSTAVLRSMLLLTLAVATNTTCPSSGATPARCPADRRRRAYQGNTAPSKFQKVPELATLN